MSGSANPEPATDAARAASHAVEIARLFAEAQAYQEQGYFAEAEQRFQRIITLDPSRDDAHANLGVLKLMAGDLVGAESALREAIRLAHAVPEYYDALGLVLDADGRVDDAAESFAAAVIMKPDLASSWHNLGNARLKVGETGEALHCLLKALNLDPINAELRLDIGRALVAAEQLDDAVGAIKLAIAVKPDSADAFEALGVVEDRRGNTDAARAAYRRYLELDPSDRHAVRARLGALDA